ncbi:MAG: serine/threonine-protein kinase, partial [Deltaproteobacteria bacterium]|nr:serine/threonine-protein kinase [Deltaproteobacteria bacterium]
NIVTVFDGGFEDAGAFVVMELIDGGSMTAWLRRTSPGPAAIVATLIDAARGLAHAHREGFVHGDFKLDNVLVASDGRVLVSDFGLAGRVGAKPERAGMGTPLYMAPERHMGHPLGPSSDQYALCVALFRALHGRYPFPVGDRERMLASKLAGRVQPVSWSAVPARVRRAVLRGLGAHPSERYGSLDALIAALGGRRRSWWMTAMTATAVLGVGAAFVVGSSLGSCPEDAAPWSSAEAERVRRGLGSSGAEFVGSTSQRVDGMLAAYASQWTQSQPRACRPWGTSTALQRPAMDAIDGCLRRARLRMDALAGVLSRADGLVAEHAVQAVESLVHPAECWRRPEPGPVAEGLQRTKLEAMLATTEAHAVVGLSATSAALAERTVEAARAADAPDVLARAQLWRGLAWIEQARHDEGRRSLEAAYYGATELGDDDTARDAAVELLRLAVHGQPDRDAAERWDRAAQSLLLRAPPVDEAWARLTLVRADHAFESGRSDVAADLYRQALALRRRRGAPSLALAESLEGMGTISLRQGSLQPALALFAETLQVRRTLLGDHHPWLAVAHNNYGIALAISGEGPRARAHFEEGLRVLEASLGSEHPRVGRVLTNLGQFALGAGDPAGARPHLARAVTILDATQGPRHRETITARQLLARALLYDGQPQPSLALVRRLLADAEQATSATIELGPLHGSLGEVLLALGHHEAAAEALETALVELSGPDPEQHAHLYRAWMAEALFGLQRWERADEEAERAWAGMNPGDARSRLALLRSRQEHRHGRCRSAVEFARVAREELPSWVIEGHPRRARVGDWTETLERRCPPTAEDAVLGASALATD